MKNKGDVGIVGASKGARGVTAMPADGRLPDPVPAEAEEGEPGRRQGGGGHCAPLGRLQAAGDAGWQVAGYRLGDREPTGSNTFSLELQEPNG